MKFVSVRTPSGPRPGLIHPDGGVQLLDHGADGSLESLLAAGRSALAAGEPVEPGDAARGGHGAATGAAGIGAATGAGTGAATGVGPEQLDLEQPRLEQLDLERWDLGAPITPGKIVCVGANYTEHVREAGAPMPQQPILFLKTPDIVVGPHDSILIPPGSTATDWEVELGVVIGTETAYLPDANQALDHVAGYVLANDVSERDFQLERGGTWDKGKNCPTFCPLGPVFVTADEVPDPQALRLGTDLNGAVMQDASTSDMIFPVSHLIHYISQYLTLHPGDVVLTGTPSGVGQGQTPPRYLREGDQLRMWADGLGEQHIHVRQAG